MTKAIRFCRVDLRFGFTALNRNRLSHAPAFSQKTRNGRLPFASPICAVADRISRCSTASSSTSSSRAMSPSPCRRRNGCGCRSGSMTVADTTKALVLYESDHLPVYYFPIERCARGVPAAVSTTTTESPFKGIATHLFAQHRHHAGRGRAPGAISIRSRAARRSPTTCRSSGARWATGSRRTRRSSSTPAIRSAGSTACPRRGGCRSFSTASRWPIHAAACSCSRPAIRCATICRSPTRGSICSRPAATSRAAPTRASPTTIM